MKSKIKQLRELSGALLDLHSESIGSAKSIIDSLNLSQSVTRYEIQDATTFVVDVDNPPDIILAEVMQACLDTEPQVAVMRNLLKQSPNATLIPNEVSVDIRLVNPNIEFGLDRTKNNNDYIDQTRIELGPIFILNKESLRSWESISENCLPGLTVQAPDSIEFNFQPMLFTEICIYQALALGVYDSGLTFPKGLYLDHGVQAGKSYGFYYQLGGQPGLRSH